MFKPEKIVIVGGNAAGPSAAAKAKRTNPEAEVIMIEAGEFISTGTCELPYVLSGEIKSHEEIVFFNAASFEKAKEVKVYTRHFVEAIDRRNREVIARDLKTGNPYSFSYDSLVLCTGSSAKSVQDIPPDTENVFSLKSVSDLVKIQDYITSQKAESCLIIGAGYIGLETADALLKLGMNVTLVDIESKPFPGGEPELRNTIAELLNESGAKFISNSGTVKYLFDGDKLAKFKYDGRLREVDLVIVSAGVEPNTRLAISSKLDTGELNGIKVDRKLKTSDPNIYAAGDNIEVTNYLTGKADYIPQATLAHLYGHIAGANAAGGNEFVKPVIKNLAFKIFGKSICQVGLTLEEAREYFYGVESVSAEAYNLVKVMPGSSKTFGKIVYRKSDKKLFGASFIGTGEAVSYSDIISTMITGNIDAGKLEEIYFNYTPPLTPFINLLSILGRKISRN